MKSGSKTVNATLATPITMVLDDLLIFTIRSLVPPSTVRPKGI